MNSMKEINLGSFKWESGNINDNIRKILINKLIRYTNTFNGDVKAEINGSYRKVNHVLEDKENEIYKIYVTI